MQLIYIYIWKFRNLQDCSLTFSDDYYVEHNKENHTLAVKVDTSSYNLGQKLYGEQVLSVHGIVGRNAVGKTNLADILSLPGRLRGKRENAKIKEEAAAYLILYAPDDRKEDSNAPLYMELSDKEGRIFPSLHLTETALEQSEEPWDGGSVPKAGWYTGWIRVGEEAAQPVWEEADHHFHGCVVSLRENINKQNFESSLSGNSLFDSVKDEESGRFIWNYRKGTLADQYNAYVRLHKLAVDSVYSDNAPPFHDQNYVIRRTALLTWKEQSNCFSRVLSSEFEEYTSLPLKHYIYRLCAFIYEHVLRKEQLMISQWMRNIKVPFDELIGRLCALPEDSYDIYNRSITDFVKETLPLYLDRYLNPEYKEAVGAFQTGIGRLSVLLKAKRVQIEEGETVLIPVLPEEERNTDLYDFLNNNEGEYLSLWYNISDGEKHLIEGFASLHGALEEAGMHITTNRTCILLLDEPELHSHPELARNFLYWLTRWLNMDAGGNRYQILVFTHSPFLLSDIDKKHVYHIIRQKEEDEDRVMIVHPEAETFAANIHDVLMDSIFLDCSVGAVAYEKLTSVMYDILNGTDRSAFSTPKDKKRLISLIGEELLRSAFVQAFESHT